MACAKAGDGKCCFHPMVRHAPGKNHGPYAPHEEMREVQEYEKCCFCGEERIHFKEPIG